VCQLTPVYFIYQRAPLPLAVPDLGGCMLLQSFGSNELSMVMADNSDMGTNPLCSPHCCCRLCMENLFCCILAVGKVLINSTCIQTAEKFLKGLLLNGWLSKLIMNCRFLEESIAKWTFNLCEYT